MGIGISWHVINTGEPIFTHDYFNQTEFQSLNVVHFGSEEHIRSVLAVPMRLGGKTMGMLSAQSYKSHHYREEDQKILDMLAAYAAIAIDNARLFEKVQQLAITDSLTGVYNRRHFFEIANQEILRARRYNHPISIIMLDLDHYKEINDTFGHDIGDEALSLIAKSCNDNIRKTDVLARYGGDEFIILLPETDITKSQEIAERLRSFLESNPIVIRDFSLNTTISVGISGAGEPIPELNSLLKCADIALYKAKETGRNCIKTHVCSNWEEDSHD
jgi:diguanylate cyclase (GGDEF)-like protein